MAPVVRVSDSVFSRLQSLAEPFVDSPSSVIERLLDQVHPVSNASAEASEGDEPVHTDRIHVRTGFNLFLAPASPENARISLSGSVRVDRTCEVMTPAACAALRAIVGTNTSFHCWAMTGTRREVFRQMKRGDVVLFSLQGTRQFDYRGTVIGTIESAELGDSLWPVTAGLPWSLIYLLDDVRSIKVRKPALNIALGYDADYRVPGVIRVNTDAVRRAIIRFGSMDALLTASS